MGELIRWLADPKNGAALPVPVCCPMQSGWEKS
jgi:hypothetical protein